MFGYLNDKFSEVGDFNIQDYEVVQPTTPELEPEEFDSPEDYGASFGAEPDMEEPPLGAEESDHAPASTHFGPVSKVRRGRRMMRERRMEIHKKAGVPRTAASMDHFAFLPLSLYEAVWHRVAQNHW